MTVWRRRLIAVGSIDDPTDNTFYRPHAAVWQSSDGLTWKRTFRYKRGGSVIQHVLPLNGASARPDTARLVGIGTALNPPTDGGCGVIPDPDPIGVWTSPDGLAWQRQRQSSVFNGATIDAAASNGRIVLAVGDTGYLEPAIWITTDGQTWRREVLPKSLFRDAHLTDLAAVPGGWILGSHTLHEQSLGCVGPDNPDHAAAWFSADGLHWQTAAIHWPDNRVQHGDVRDFQVTAALISAGDFQSLDGGRRWTWNRATRLPFQPRAADGQRMILQAADPTSSNDNGAADDPLPFLASSNLTDWQSLAASGDVADMPSHRYNLDGLFVLPGGIVALGSANSDGSLRLWVAAAT